MYMVIVTIVVSSAKLNMIANRIKIQTVLGDACLLYAVMLESFASRAESTEVAAPSETMDDST
jgi:hypothetical protein